MDVLFAVLLVVVFGTIFFVQWLVQENQKLRIGEAFRVAAFAHDGTVENGDDSGQPTVRFYHNDAQVLLDVFSAREGLYTQLHFVWADPHLRLEVFPDRGLSTLGKLLGAQDIIIGSADFDRDYIIRGNDEPRITELLTGDIQAKINELRRLLGNDDIFIGTKAGVLLIKKRKGIYDAETLEQFISKGLEVYENLIGLGSEGVEFVPQQDLTSSLESSNTACQICGEAMTSDRVYCRSCRTAHHQDCWTYYGKCSTYGCGETRYKASVGAGD